MNEVKRSLSVWGALHIHTNKAGRIQGRRFGDQSADDVPCQGLIDVEAHMCELQTDVGVQMICRNGIENLVIKLGAVPRFVEIGDVFTQVIDADAHASVIHRLGYPHGIGDLGACYKTAGNTLTNGRTFRKIAQTAVFRKLDEEGPQHGVPATSKKNLGCNQGDEVSSEDRKTTGFCITTQDSEL